MRSNMVCKIFTCDHSMQQSFFRLHKIYIDKKGVGGGSELEISDDTFKTIARHKLVDTN